MAIETATSTSPSASSVTGAIRKASQLTGTNFGYLLATAKVESNLNPNAAAPTSSAGGLFQFIEQTWLGTIKDAGPSLGYGRQAAAISQTESGRFVVTDPAMRQEIMALRKDATANAVMGGAFTKSNAEHLTKRLGRAPSEGELYIAHFMGANGAANLIGMAESKPGAAAADAFPSAAKANRSIFFDRSGKARNFAEVTQNLVGRYQVARAKQNSAPTDAVAAASFVTQTARVARAYEVAAPTPTTSVRNISVQGEPTFHNPYRTAERRQAVAPVVSDLWKSVSEVRPRSGSQPAERVADASRQAPVTQSVQISSNLPEKVDVLGLFQDSKPDGRALFTAGRRG